MMTNIVEKISQKALKNNIDISKIKIFYNTQWIIQKLTLKKLCQYRFRKPIFYSNIDLYK